MSLELVTESREVDGQFLTLNGVPLWKRGLDLACILVSSPVLIPLMLILGGIIKCVSPGPVLFRQERIGYRGRRFVCLKYRTMKENADVDVHRRHLANLIDSDSPMVKMDSQGDSRLIPLGSLLRATGLDELPQIFNVLRGEMSLVGPRPCLPYEYENHGPSARRRFETLPGLTGLWQVSGKNKTTFSTMVFLDLVYAENKSPWLDLMIMIKTIPALISQVMETRENGKKRFRPGKEAATAKPRDFDARKREAEKMREPINCR